MNPLIDSEKKHIYFLQTYTGSLLSRAIKKFSAASYSHVSIGLEDSLQKFYSFGRKRPKNPLWAGFVQEDIKTGVYQIFENTKFAIYKLEVTQEEYDKLTTVIQSFEENKNCYRYNLLGIVTAKVGFSVDRRNAYFCSQFVATALEQSGINVIDKKAGLVHPMDFADIEGIELIYEGVLKEFTPELPEEVEMSPLDNKVLKMI